MTRSEQSREKFLEILADMPFISYASKKIAISRATIYRWLKDNDRFRRGVQKALRIGRENIVDIAEVELMKQVRRGNMAAIKLLLNHNAKRYSSFADVPELETEKKDKYEAFRGADGRFMVSKDSVEFVRKKYAEKQKRKNRAMGFPDPD